MPNLWFYTCRQCGAGHEITTKDFNLACYPDDVMPTDDMRSWLEKYIETFYCDDCACCVTLRSELDSGTWERWKETHPCRHSFEGHLRSRIDVWLASGHTARVDIGEILCPYCGK